jgi:hypothetical protein
MGDAELAGPAGLEFDIVEAELFEAFPHTEGLRLVASSTGRYPDGALG